MSVRPVLCSFNHITAIPTDRGSYILAERMIDGMQKYCEYWDGDVVAVVEPAEDLAADRALSGANQEVNLGDLPFRCEVIDHYSPNLRKLLEKVSVVHSGIGHRNLHLGKLCQEVDIPIVWGSEYSLQTRMQVITAERKNWIRRLRGYQWEAVNELRQVRAIRKGIGIQCNGTPTYYAYKNLTANPILFFDGRTGDDQLITTSELDQRLDHLQDRQPLRLAWSGRLNNMKGANHLVHVAAHLKKMNVPFSLRIFGGGALADQLNEEIRTMDLSNEVNLEGYIPFNEELVPLMKREVDIWLCCHVQGDPSGAYLETLSFGVPIIGYNNEAFAGVLRHANDVGEMVRLGDSEALAKAVSVAAENRGKIAQWSRNAMEFASEHTFEKTFERRVRHIEHCLSDYKRSRRYQTEG